MIYTILTAINCALALAVIVNCLRMIAKLPREPQLIPPLFGSAAYIALQAEWITSPYPLIVDRTTDTAWMLCEMALLVSCLALSVVKNQIRR